MSATREFIATFGCGQKYENGYYVVMAVDHEEAQEEMVRLFGNQWSRLYESREAAGVDKWELYEVK